MSVEQYQRIVNSLDKDIADLEKKKAALDKKAIDEQKKAAGITFSKSSSSATVRSKLKQRDNHLATANKASGESVVLANKIADKRKKRIDAAVHLQKEEANAQKKRDMATKRMQQSYERRIEELQALSSPTILPINKVIENTLPEYDVFVSHAWEDKAEFVDEFVDELCKLGIKVWYDTSEIKWGDSMRARIDDGLKKSKFGVAILSPDYIKDGKYWTKAELDSLFQLESINGKTLLPIWHKLTKKDVMEFSPIIGSKLAMTTTTMTPAEIAAELLSLLSHSGSEKL